MEIADENNLEDDLQQLLNKRNVKVTVKSFK